MQCGRVTIGIKRVIENTMRHDYRVDASVEIQDLFDYITTNRILKQYSIDDHRYAG